MYRFLLSLVVFVILCSCSALRPRSLVEVHHLSVRPVTVVSVRGPLAQPNRISFFNACGTWTQTHEDVAIAGNWGIELGPSVWTPVQSVDTLNCCDSCCEYLSQQLEGGEDDELLGSACGRGTYYKLELPDRTIIDKL